jgi:hypothetical protein
MTIITNPPYSGSLHLKILREAMKHSDDIVNLSPDICLQYKWGENCNKIASFLDGHIIDYDKLSYEDSDKYFGIGNSIGGLAIYHIGGGNNGKTRAEITFSSEIERSIYEKILFCNKPNKLGWENKNTKRHGPQIPNCVNLYTWHRGSNAYETCIREDGNYNRTVYFDTPEQAENFKNMFKTKFMEWYCRKVIWAGNGIVDKCFMFDKDDYTHPWTDDMLYKYFGLTDGEIKTIENEVKEHEI